jgi:hypothetical protein
MSSRPPYGRSARRVLLRMDCGRSVRSFPDIFPLFGELLEILHVLL